MVVLYRQLELTTNGSRSRTADITGNKADLADFREGFCLLKLLLHSG
jgi:hypothetical protein